MVVSCSSRWGALFGRTDGDMSHVETLSIFTALDVALFCNVWDHSFYWRIMLIEQAPLWDLSDHLFCLLSISRVACWSGLPERFSILGGVNSLLLRVRQSAPYVSNHVHDDNDVCYGTAFSDVRARSRRADPTHWASMGFRERAFLLAKNMLECNIQCGLSGRV